MKCRECVQLGCREVAPTEKTHLPSGVVVCAHLDQGGGEAGVGDPAGEEQRLPLLHVEHVQAQAFLLHERLLHVCNPEATAKKKIHTWFLRRGRLIFVIQGRPVLLSGGVPATP